MSIKKIPTLREIERKFTFDRQCIQSLWTNAGSPPFTSLTPLKRSIFQDTYYDTPSRILSKNPNGAIWLRTRIYDNSVSHQNYRNVSIDSGDYKFPKPSIGMIKWQAKVAKLATKDYKTASYDEVTDLSMIKHLIQNRVYPDRLLESTESKIFVAENNFGLGEYCKFITDRIEFTADGKFIVALDKTDFGHDVGEVEIVAQEGEEDEKVLGVIEGFMERYKWLFKSGKGEPKGKMTVYFEKFGGW